MSSKSVLPSVSRFWKLVVICWLASAIQESAGQARITYVTPGRGSVVGGTKVTVYGYGFTTDSYTSSNLIFFGSIPCVVVPYTVSAHRLECVTSPHPSADEGFSSSRLQSSVITNGQLFTSSNSYGSFYYDWNYTPQVRTVEPKSAPLGTLVEIGGYRMFWDYKYYEQFFVGGEICEIRNGTTNEHFGIRWTGWPVHLINGTTNDHFGIWWRWPVHLIKCLVTEQQAGGWNASVTLNHWRGKTWNHSQALYPVYDWSLAMFELYPDVHQVYPQEGSVHGGTLVTISGTGFSADDGEIEVDIDGIPCQVLSHTSNEIQCLTGAPPQGSPAVASESGDYPDVEDGYRFKGGRGANFMQYNDINGNQLQHLHSSTIYPDRPQRKGVYPSFSTLSYSKRNNYGERLTAFFNPHTSGRHTFFLTNDDEGGLWFSSGNNITSVDSNKIISSQYVSGWENYYRYQNQRSDVQDLEVSKDYIVAAEFKDSGGGDYIQVGVLIHETDFTYDETQQVERERQRVELSSDGLYDIQRLSLTLNTTELDSDSPPTFTVEWGGRQSDRFTFQELQEDTNLLAETILELFSGVCDYGQEIGVNHYQEVYGFEGGLSNAWNSWGGGVPEVSDDEAFCGRHSLFVKGGRGLAFNVSQPDDNDGYRVSDYPFLCLAYKLDQGQPMSIAVNIYGVGWRSISMTMTGTNTFPLIGSFWDYSDDDLVDNDNWQYSCTDLQDMLMQSLEQSINEDSIPTYRVTGLGYYTSPGGSSTTGFYVDEVSISSEKRNFVWENYIRPARPNGVALHDIITTAQTSNNYDVVNLVVSMEIVPSACYYDLPLINVTLLDLENTPGLVDFDFSKVQEASIPISGTFQLGFSSGNTSSVSYGATVQELEQAIEAVDDVGDVTVTYRNTHLPQDRLEKFCPGRHFTVQFEDKSGDLPLFAIDTSSLVGDGLRARVIEEVTGGLFLRPIPGHMLQTVEETPQVHVRIRNQLAACGGGFGVAKEVISEQYHDFCMFKYSPVANPVVDSINPLSAQGGDTIEIRGSGFSQESDDLYVRFGDAECRVTSSTNTTIQCTLSESFAGPKPLYLHVRTRGITNTSDIVLHYSLELESVSPNQGSIAGGTQVTLNGRGFYDPAYNGAVNAELVFQRQFELSHGPSPNTEDCQNVVTMGDSVCEIIQSNATVLTFLTPAEMNNMSTYDVAVTVLCPEGPHTSSSQTLTASYTYDTVLTPVLTSIQPTVGYIQGGDSVTLNGTGFSSVSEENTVKIGGSLCVITSSSSTQITCTTPAHDHSIGEAYVQVSVDGKGTASGVVTFTYQLEINSVSHCQGSLFGGQTLDIDGLGFGQDQSQIEVRLGDHPCNIVRLTDTNILCVTTSTASEHYINNNAFHEEYGLGYAWNPSSLTVEAGDTVHWSWTGSSFVTRRGVAEVHAPGDTEYNGIGFRSRQSITGNFSHTFTTPGTYYYITEGYAHIGFNGSVTVVEKGDVEAELTVVVNSVVVNTSAFNTTCGYTNSPFQMYTYSIASTPVIHSVTPTATVGDRINLVISGLSDIAEDNTFLFGGQAPVTCISSNFSRRTAPLYTSSALMRTYQANSEVECIVSHMSPSIYRTLLHVAGRGWSYASLENSVLRVLPRIDSVSVTSGSLRGGSSLFFQMTGVVPSDIAKTRVVIGNTPCPVQSISSGGQVECTTQFVTDDGYSSIISRDSPLAYWSLQADYYRSDGSYLDSDGEFLFRSGGTLGVGANASTFGTVMTQQRGISANTKTDQSALFQSSYIQTPVLPEFSEATGFAMDLWIMVPQPSGHYQIVVDSYSFADGVASGFLLMLNPCAQLEFWVATGVSLQDAYSTNSSVDCELITDTTNCSQICSGHLYMPESESLPSGAWNIIRAEYTNLTSWQFVHFGWASGNNASTDDCVSLAQCSGQQVLYINNYLLEETTSYSPSVSVPVSIGGSNQALVPFVGYLDEVAFYHKPLDSQKVQARVRYGSSDSQPIWVTVNGVDGVGLGNTPDIAYMEVEQGFTNDTVINWDTVQELYVHIEESTAIRFEWTGLHGILQSSRSAFEECDLTSPYIKEWFKTKKGGVMTFTPVLGAVYYFIDSVSGGCQNGRKIRIEVGDVEVIDWHIREYSDLTISEGTGLLFQWDDSVPHNLFEMTTAVSSMEECQFVGDSADTLGKVKVKWQDEPTTTGEISVNGLSVGEHHFACAVNRHCQAGMRFTVRVTRSNLEHATIEQEDTITHTIPWRVQDYEDLTIVEGDTIVFGWQGFHSLHQVTEDAYSVCDVGADSMYVWGEPSVDNSATIDGLVSGSYYFICSIAGHCDAGMKIKVTVLPSDGLPALNNGVPANCAENVDCSFAYSVAATPQLLWVQPTEAAAGTVITLRGRGFIPSGTTLGTNINSVTVVMDKVPCENVVALSSTPEFDEIQCTVADYESGYYFVDVFVGGKGYASVNPTELVPSDIRNSTFSANFQSIYPTFFLIATANTINPLSGSLLGGTLVDISGSGFSYLPSHLDVQIANAPCNIITSSFSRIQCLTTAASTSTTTSAQVRIRINGFPVNSSLQFEQSSQSTPTVTQLDCHSVARGDQIMITGSKFGSNETEVKVQVIRSFREFDISSTIHSCLVSSINDTIITCTVPTKAAGGYHVHVLVQGLGFADIVGNNFLSYPLAIDSFSPTSGGNGGGITLVVDGAGFPDISSGDDFSSIVVTLCNNQVECSVTESSFLHLMCTLGVNSQSEQNCSITVNYNGMTETSSELFQFAPLLTPELTDLSPTIGGTAGGTNVTLTGTGFFPINATSAADLEEDDIVITIDGAVCEWYGLDYQLTETSVTCRTGMHRTTLQAMVRLYVRGKGFAIHHEETSFEYVDRWSSHFTWGGNALPSEGESVYIKLGQTVYLDISPPVLNLLLIEGTLVFEDDQDLHLQAKYIFINGGKLQIGTETNPFQHRAVVTLHGYITDPEIPVYGAKVLGIRQGQLDLHGIPRRATWTRLASTALTNATSLHLQESVDWVHGDQIVIAPTGKDGNETEENEVSSLSPDGRTVHLMNPLKFTHHGVTETLEDGQFIELRAEVGLLSHNVIVEGTRLESSNATHGLGADQYGGQIFIHRTGPDPTPIRIEHTEVRYCGQAFRLGRYSVHFHLSGTMNGSYVRNCAIHHSNNRAIAAHGVHDLLIEGNVAYDIKGHTYFVEDGIETNNRYIGNLGVLTRGSSSLLNTDQIPATFWITNPQNTFIGNAAAASRAYGFWYDLDYYPSGASFTYSVCPNKETFGTFVNNTAHTCNEFGLRIWETYVPYADGCRAGIHQIANLYNFTTYANGINGVELSIVGHVRLVGFKVADNVRNGIEIIETRGHWGGPKIQDTLVVSHTSINTGAPQQGGIKTPNTPRLIISNVTFGNFDVQSTACLKACSHCKFREGGFQVWFERLNFIGGSGNNKAAFQWEFEVLYKDLDGTLTGLDGGGWVLPNSDLVPPDLCTTSVPEFSLNRNIISGTVCSRHVNFLRMAWNRAEPLATLKGVDVIVVNEFGSALVPWQYYRLTHWEGYMFTMPDNQLYNITWLLPVTHRVDTTSYNAGVYGVKPSSDLWITHQFMVLPDHVEVGYNYEGTEHGDVPLETDNNFSWHINNVVTYLISGGNHTSEDNNIITYQYSYEPCPRDGCPPLGIDFGPYEAFQRHWSDPSSWPSGELPSEGEEVTISSRWRMLVDISPPPLGRVIVLGELMFEDERDYNFTANLILINGPMARVIIGTESSPFTHSVVITLTGRREDVPLVLTKSVIVGSKAIGVFGNLSIHGIQKSHSWTRLSSSAQAGDTSITVQGSQYPNWRAGDEIVISPSGWNPQEAEIRTITEINGGRITLNESLAHDHVIYSFMEPSDLQAADPPQTSGSPQWWDDGGQMAPEVGLLSHNIVIQGGEDPGQLLEEHHYGCRLLVGKYTTQGYTFHGHLKLDSVEFRFCGQGGYFSPRDPRYAIAFRNNFNSSEGSYIRRCSIHHSYNTAIGVHTSHGVEINSNVIWRTTDSSIKVGRKFNNIINNLAMLTTTVQPNSPPDNHAVDFPATFDIDGENVVRGNAAAGSTRIAFRYSGEPCLDGNEAPTHDAAMFWNNSAHTGLIGLNVRGLPYDCTAIGGFTSSHQWNYAVFSSTASSLSATHLKVALGKVGLNLNVFGPNPVAHLLGKKSIIIRDSLLVGSLPGEACVTSAPDFRVRGGVSFSLGDHKIGIMMSSFNAKRSQMDGTGAWHLMKGYPVVDGVTEVERVSFARFFDEGCDYNSYTIANNPLSPDAVHPMHMSTTTKYNVSLSSLVFYYEPDIEWIVQEDCVDMDCDGPKHSLLKDLDGQFVGTFPAEGSVVPFAELRFSNYNHRLPVTWLASVREGELANYNEVLEHVGIARGEPNNLDSPGGGCEWRESWNAYRCKTLQHHMLIIESMDDDSETRRLSPLALTGGDTGHGDYTDLINGPMDHGWCVYYTCLKRLSTFFTIVAVGTDYCIWMTGSPPSSIRFTLLNSGDDDAVKLCIWFKGTSRKDVYKNGIFIEPENVRYLSDGGVEQLDGDYVPEKSSISGANYFERGSQVMHFIVKGSEPVEIRTPPVIQVSMSLAVSIDDFFSIGDLINNLAFVLKIDPNKIRVVKIVSEATPVRVRRSLLATSGFNQTSITLEFGSLPAPNITTAEPPSVSEEIALAGETNDIVDEADNKIPDTPLEGTNPLNEDSPDTINDFVESLNSSISEYNDQVTAYEEVLSEVESTNTIGEQVINLILTNEVENITNATVVSLSVVPALPPPPPRPPVLPPLYQNTTDEDGDPIQAILETIQTVMPPPLAVDVTESTDDDGEVHVDFVIPSEMRVTMEPLTQTGHLVHVAVTIFDNSGKPVINLGLVNPWMCRATLVLTKGQEGSTQLGGVTSVPFVHGVAEFTRLRVESPAQDLTLQFITIPSRFEVRTSVLFSVVSPPSNTSRERVEFLLEGNLATLSNNKREVLNAIELALSMKLDVDISRIKDLDYTVTPQGLQVSFDLLNRQPSDPPDVRSLEESITHLQALISAAGALSFPIGNEIFTASSFEFVTPPPSSEPVDTTIIIIAVCTAAGVILLSVIVLCCCVKICKRKSTKQKGKGSRAIPSEKISPMPSAEIPMVALYGRSPVNTSGGRAVVAGPPHRRSVGKGAPYGRLPVIGGRAPAKKVLLVKESEVFTNTQGAPPPWANQQVPHHYRHHHRASSANQPTTLSNLANSMQQHPSQSGVMPGGTRPTNRSAPQLNCDTPPAGSYLVRPPRKPRSNGQQGWS